MLFDNELMRCSLCGAEQRYDPEERSDWRAIQFPGEEHVYYVCPVHFPEDGALREEYSDAYLDVFVTLAALRGLSKTQLANARRKTMYIASAFSLNMLAELNAEISVRPLEIEDVRDFHRAAPGLESVVGHADTAAVFSEVLGFDVPCNRATLALGPGDRLVVGQYRGPRLEAGATQLPEGAVIEWALVVIRRGR